MNGVNDEDLLPRDLLSLNTIQELVPPGSSKKSGALNHELKWEYISLYVAWWALICKYYFFN